MHPKQIWANFAVNNIAKTIHFYTSLGFKQNSRHISNDLACFFFGENNFVINFFLKDSLQKNFKGEITDSQKSNEILFTISAENKTEVDHWANEVEKAGGKLISHPEEFGPGYYGFIFADPDGHRFNVFYMDGM